MRTSLELLDLPYTFVPLPLVGAEKFAALARERGVMLDRWRLEAIHQVGLLVPLFRVKRRARDIRASFKRGDDHRAHVLARWEPTRREDLLEAINEHLLFDPTSERFHSRRSFEREIDGYRFESGVYLYSQHQLACLGPVSWLLPSIAWRRRDDSFAARLKMDAEQRADWLELGRKLHEAVIAIVALEPVYYSRIIGMLTTPVHFDTDAFVRWRLELDADSSTGSTSTVTGFVSAPARSSIGRTAGQARRLERGRRRRVAETLGRTRRDAAAGDGHTPLWAFS